MAFKNKQRLKKGIIKDPIHPSDYLNLIIPTSCEDCLHFSDSKETCSLGYDHSHHRQRQQKKDFTLSGRVAICRFLEIN